MASAQSRVHKSTSTYRVSVSPLKPQPDEDAINFHVQQLGFNLVLPENRLPFPGYARFDFRVSGIAFNEIDRGLIIEDFKLQLGFELPFEIKNVAARILFDNNICWETSSLHLRVDVSVHEEWKLQTTVEDTIRAAEALERVICDRDSRDGCCSVCLEEFQVGFEASKMPCCSNLLHLDCISSCFQKIGLTCPLCRRCVCTLCRR